MQTVLQTVDKFSDIAKLFSKNIFFKTKNFVMNCTITKIYKML